MSLDAPVVGIHKNRKLLLPMIAIFRKKIYGNMILRKLKHYHYWEFTSTKNFNTRYARIKKDLYNFMAINATIVKQAKSVLQGFQKQCLRVKEHSHFALEQTCIYPTMKSISPNFISSLKFFFHPNDTRDSLYSLYIPDINKVNWVLLKINYLFMWSFKLTGV